MVFQFICFVGTIYAWIDQLGITRTEYLKNNQDGRIDLIYFAGLSAIWQPLQWLSFQSPIGFWEFFCHEYEQYWRGLTWKIVQVSGMGSGSGSYRKLPNIQVIHSKLSTCNQEKDSWFGRNSLKSCKKEEIRVKILPLFIEIPPLTRKDGRVVECGGLENR